MNLEFIHAVRTHYELIDTFSKRINRIYFYMTHTIISAMNKTYDVVSNWVKKNTTEFNHYFKERDAEINGSLLALLSGEHVLLLGPPGTAKTLLANKICETIEGGNFFHYLLTRFSTPE
jgi:MoxR-like ATPase